MATTDSIVSKLPANVEAERSILGAILLDNMATTKPQRICGRMIFRSTHTGASLPHDGPDGVVETDHIITLVEELERKRELQAIGDVGYISGLLDGVPDRPSIEHYVHIVRDKAVLRGLINYRRSDRARF